MAEERDPAMQFRPKQVPIRKEERGAAEEMMMMIDGAATEEVENGAVDATVALTSPGSNQLTLLFQGELYVFDSVTAEKVQAVLLLLGGCEVPSGMGNLSPTCHQDKRGLDDILQRKNMPARRVASLIRFREKRKERCFEKKIRYSVRKEVALRMRRRKGQFVGKAAPQETEATSTCDPSQSSSQDLTPSRCQNCGATEKETPAMRRGPAGPKSLCNACGLMWANKGTLRSHPRSSKLAAQNFACEKDQIGEINNHHSADNKNGILNPNNHVTAGSAAEDFTEDFSDDVQVEFEMEEDLKTR